MITLPRLEVELILPQHFCFARLEKNIPAPQIVFGSTVPDGAAHDRLLLFAAASGLSRHRLDVGAPPAHP